LIAGDEKKDKLVNGVIKPNKVTSNVKASSHLPEDEHQSLNAVDSRDQYDFDLSNDDSKNVISYVPQRQAAKKAAEHIRSGLSNIVAARLIIEDEMEAATKKPKGEKIQKGDKQIPQPNIKKSQDASSIISSILSGKKLKQSKGKSTTDTEDVLDSAAEKSDDVGKGKSKKRPPTKGKMLLSCSVTRKGEVLNHRLMILVFLIRGCHLNIYLSFLSFFLSLPFHS